MINHCTSDTASWCDGELLRKLAGWRCHYQYDDWSRLARLIAKAMSMGAVKIGPATWEWSIAGDCLVPHRLERFARPSADREAAHREVEIGPASLRGPLRLLMETRCRRCENCLRKRAAAWRVRAVAETRFACRSWFGTLTLSPDHRVHFLSVARKKAAGSGIDYDALPAGERFERLVWAVSPAITRYFKRLRKESGSKFRYLLVAEEHKDGFPHWHLLIHEQSEVQPVRKSALERQWHLGFSSWRLVNSERQAFYVVKYLAKGMLARVRASIRYGHLGRPIDIHPKGGENFDPKPQPIVAEDLACQGSNGDLPGKGLSTFGWAGVRGRRLSKRAEDYARASAGSSKRQRPSADTG